MFIYLRNYARYLIHSYLTSLFSFIYLYYNNCEFHFQLFQMMRKQTQSSKSHLFPTVRGWSRCTRKTELILALHCIYLDNLWPAGMCGSFPVIMLWVLKSWNSQTIVQIIYANGMCGLHCVLKLIFWTSLQYLCHRDNSNKLHLLLFSKHIVEIKGNLTRRCLAFEV